MKSYFVAAKTQIAHSAQSAQQGVFKVKSDTLDPITEQNVMELVFEELINIRNEITRLKENQLTTTNVITQALQAMSTVGDIEPFVQKIEMT